MSTDVAVLVFGGAAIVAIIWAIRRWGKRSDNDETSDTFLSSSSEFSSSSDSSSSDSSSSSSDSGSSDSSSSSSDDR
jgi:cytoskeletal protein RodZ